MLAVIAILILVSRMYRNPPTRRCDHCNHRVELEQRVCPNCGYEFEPVRTTR